MRRTGVRPAPQESQGPVTGEEQPPAQPQTDEPAKIAAEEPQMRRPMQPQFKLQAKITGLERTGRKDPILRFDVHVRQLFFPPASLTIGPLTSADQYSQLSNYPIPRCPSLALRVRQARRAPDFRESRSYRASGAPSAHICRCGHGRRRGQGQGLDAEMAELCVCSNEVLMRDEEMVLFAGSDFGYSPLMKKKQPATGVRRKILKQFAPPPDDTPQLQEARPIVKLFYLGTMDAGHKVDKLVKSRRGKTQNPCPPPGWEADTSRLQAS